MKYRLGSLLTLSCLAVSAPAIAAPVDFACGKPVFAVPEIKDRSRYGFFDQVRTYEVDVYLNAEPKGVGIKIAPKKFGVCRLILPVGAFLQQQISWREATGAGLDHGVYRALDIREAAGPRAHTDWVLLRPKDPTVSGKTTIEFQVSFDYLEANPGG
jgi:hypothetical protein